ncbi:MAG: PD40 domain-containing protein [Gammaproteobacteria bacterium]|nr:PD40 domain-containing protein [Gammaproteobacteria bacterium]
MRLWRGGLLGLIVSVTAAVVQAAAHDPDLNWATIESPHFILHYHQGEAAIAQRLALIAERVQQRHSAWLQWTPHDKTEIVISDESDLANGFTTVMPSTRFTMYLAAPNDINSLEAHDGWWEYLITHEYLHVVHLDKVSGGPAALQKIFGRYPLLFPNQFQPHWLIEGIATYAETDTQRGIGRGQSSLFNMLMRMEVANGIKPVEQINQPIASWPYGYTAYLYGVYYYQFLRDRYGDHKIQDLVSNYSSNIIPYRINSTSEQTFGKSLDPLWEEFGLYLQQKFQPQLAAITQAGEQAGTPLTNASYEAGPLRVLPDGRVFFIANRGDSQAGLYLKAPGQPLRKLRDVNDYSRLDLHPQQGILLIQPEVCHQAAIYYDLYRVDFNGENLRRLTHCGRYHHAVWTADGQHILAAQQVLGQSALHRLSADGGFEQVLWAAPDDTQISNLSIDPTGETLVAALWRKSVGWGLEQFDFQRNQWQVLSRDTAIENQPQFSADGKSLVYSADNNGVYNIYQLNLASGERVRLTNVLGGAFSPQWAGDTLYYIGYRASGFDVFMLPHPAPLPVTETRTQPQPPVPTPPPATITTTSPQEYSPWYGLQPRWWFPHLLVDKQHAEVGVVSAGWDALQLHNYSVDLAYDGRNHWAVGGLDYIYNRYWPVLHLGMQRQSQIYLDARDNPTHYRLEDTVVGEVILPFISLQDRWALHGAALTDHEYDTKVASGVKPFADLNDDILGLGITYQSAQRYPKSVSRNNGRDLRLVWESSDAIGNSSYTGTVIKIDWREFISLGGQQVLGLRYVEGHGSDTSRVFQLGGIQNNTNALLYLLNGAADPLFNIRKYTLRGYNQGYTALMGRNMRLGSIEYRFPIRLVERGWMTPPLGLHQIHGTVFYDRGAAWDRGAPDKYYSGFGLEANAEVTLLYELRVQASLGLAHGQDRDLGGNQLYLRLGHNF